MPTEKMMESEEEKKKTYGAMVQELGTKFLRNPKRFKSAMNGVSDMLDAHELHQLKAIGRDVEVESVGDFEDQFEEACGGKDAAVKRELVRLALRDM